MRIKHLGVLALLVATIGLGAAAPALAWTDTEAYSLNVSPGTVPGGTATTYTFALGNSPQNGDNLGSAKFTPPSGFTVSSASLPAGSRGSVAVSGNTVQLSDLSISPGAKLNVSVTATAPSGCTSYSYTWTSAAGEGEDLGEGETLTLTSTGSNLTTNVNAPCSVAFGTQPADARVGQPISTSPFNSPAGGPVQVSVLNANGSVDTSYNGPVTVTLNTPANPLTNPTPSSLGGTTTRNASSGVASFNDLTVNNPGNGYTLSASGANSTSKPSNAFNIQQQGQTCQSSSTCTTEAKSSDAGTPGAIDATMISPGGTYLGVQQPNAILSESIDFGTWPAATRAQECPDETPGAHFVYGSFTTSSGAPVTRAFELDVTTQAKVTDNIAALTPGQMICFASSHPFTAQKGVALVPAQAVTLPDGSPGYAGEAPTCNNATGFNNPAYPTVDPTTGPCVSDREGSPTPAGSGVGGTLTIKMTSPYDMWGN